MKPAGGMKKFRERRYLPHCAKCGTNRKVSPKVENRGKHRNVEDEELNGALNILFQFPEQDC
jgi:hypothetical protein